MIVPLHGVITCVTSLLILLASDVSSPNNFNFNDMLFNIHYNFDTAITYRLFTTSLSS